MLLGCLDAKPSFEAVNVMASTVDVQSVPFTMEHVKRTDLSKACRLQTATETLGNVLAKNISLYH